MQQLENLGRVPRAVVAPRVSPLAGVVAGLEDRLGDFDIPVAKNVIDEMIGGIGPRR